MTLIGVGVRAFDRVRKEHALLLTCACVAILLFNSPGQRFAGGLLSLTTSNSNRDESEIDSALQDAAASALAGRDGTVIVMDAQTGRVRAIVNSERAYAQALLPGSAIKPFTALAALRAGVIDEDSRTVCPGRFTGLSFSLPCVHADHLPPFSPSQAIAYSCNFYFATLGQRLGRDRLLAILREFDFGQPTGIAEEEVSGIVRPCEMGSGARVRTVEANHASEEADCDAREAIGESDHIQVTPIQLLSAYAALVNGGHLYEPRVARPDNFNSIERAKINIAAQHRAIITEGMAGAVRYGTARSAKLDALPLTIIGKTGTANPPQGFRTNGWFIGFGGPFQSNRQLDPADVKIAVLVLLARAHGSQAAEIAKPIFETYANEVGHRDTETGSISKQETTSDDSNSSEPPRLPLSASTVRVHLVHDNVTQELSLEDYVLGVMHAEGTMEDQPEALKALAIAIRTYALKNIGRHAKDGFDFCSTTHCQRFVGAPASLRSDRAHPARNEVAAIDAVRATEGQVLLDDRGQPIDSYFGASCGGETANIGELWGVTPPAYLRGVRDEYCDAGPHAIWTDTIKRSDLWRALKSDSRTDIGNRLDQVLISKRDETGRAEWITLEGENRKTVRGWDFKIIVGRVLGWNVLKSSRFEVARSGSNFVFHGSGFGHGLGLCQEGAHVMAARGASYQKILEKYFPGTSLKPRSGAVSLARLLKAADHEGENPLVASATNESGSLQPTLARRTEWRADLIPALKGRNNFTGVYATPISPRSGGMFMAPQTKTNSQFCRSAVSTSRFAPTEIIDLSKLPDYKYSVPTGPGASTRFITVSSENFRVTYPSDLDRRDANQVLKTLEDTRNEYLHRASSASLSINLPNLDIRLNESTGDFTSRTGQPWWSAAATKGNRIELQPVAILKRRGILFTTLRHELAHVVIDSASHNRAPRWLEEGFAIYLAGEGKLFSHYQTRGALSNEELEKRLERPGSRQDMRALYAQAYQKISELIRSNGESAVWKRMSQG